MTLDNVAKATRRLYKRMGNCNNHDFQGKANAGEWQADAKCRRQQVDHVVGAFARSEDDELQACSTCW